MLPDVFGNVRRGISARIKRCCVTLGLVRRDKCTQKGKYKYGLKNYQQSIKVRRHQRDSFKNNLKADRGVHFASKLGLLHSYILHQPLYKKLVQQAQGRMHQNIDACLKF